MVETESMEAVLDVRPNDWTQRLVIADAYEDNGDDTMSKAHRWMAKNKTCPQILPRSGGASWSCNRTYSRYGRHDNKSILPEDIFCMLADTQYPAVFPDRRAAEKALAWALELSKKTRVRFGMNLHYNGVEVDYNSVTNCESRGCDGICRCGRIEDTEARPRLSAVLSTVINDEPDVMNIYAAERLLVKHRAWDSEAYDVQVTGGYYGEEIDGVRLVSALKIWQQYCEFIQLSTLDEQVEWLLRLEYGNMASLVEGLSWSLEVVNTADVTGGKPTDVVKDYENRRPEMVAGVLKAVGKKLLLVDGNHRWASGIKDCPEAVFLVGR